MALKELQIRMLLLALLLLSPLWAARLYGSISIPEGSMVHNATLLIKGEGFSYLYSLYGKQNYSLELPEGNYTITAEFVSADGLLLYSFSNKTSLSQDTKLDILFVPPKEEFPYWLIILVFFLMLVALFFFYQRYQEEQWRYYQEAQRQSQLDAETPKSPEDEPKKAKESKPAAKKEAKARNAIKEEKKEPKEEEGKAHKEKIEEIKKGPKEEKEEKPEPIASFEVEFEGEEKQERPKESELPSDSRKLILELKLHRGRMLKKDLKRILKYPDSTLDLVLAELEDYGFIKVSKEGKEKVVALSGIEEENKPTQRPAPSKEPKAQRAKAGKSRERLPVKKPAKKKPSKRRKAKHKK
ncbi:MAG: hypothetical protein QW035_02125 [Candidatus Anstonellales archaeon]